MHVICLFTASKEALKAIRELDATESIHSEHSSNLSSLKSSGSPSRNSSLRTTLPSTSKHNNAWKKLVKQFWRVDKNFCDSRFKMIPQIIEGNWAIKMAVGNKPALTGKKLVQTYTRGKGYLEIDIDISASSMATGILAMVKSYFFHVIFSLVFEERFYFDLLNI